MRTFGLLFLQVLTLLSLSYCLSPASHVEPVFSDNAFSAAVHCNNSELYNTEKKVILLPVLLLSPATLHMIFFLWKPLLWPPLPPTPLLALYYVSWRLPLSNFCWKSHYLTKNLLKIYCPISNLPFLSRILEKVILHKLLSHLQKNNLSNPFQSAYQAGHSTETVLLGIVNDILSALDSDTISVLLLDLSAAFDTIDHQILLSHLNSVWGIQSTALQWFQSYLSDISPLLSITHLRHNHSSCTVCLRAQYWGPFSSSCTLHLSLIS